MSTGQNWAERREFGRRPSNIEAYAVLPGHVQVPCTIINLSDGGALLAFAEDVKLPATLRLVIDDTPFNLLSEVRHRNGRNVGVRFVRLAEGIALNRHFHRTPTEPAGEALAVQTQRPAKAMAAASNRDLRRTVMGAGTEADEAPAYQAVLPAYGVGTEWAAGRSALRSDIGEFKAVSFAAHPLQ